MTYDGKHFLDFTAAPGEVNDLRISGATYPKTVVDLGAPVVVGAGCLDGVPVTCPSLSGGHHRIYLGDRNDRASSRNSGANSYVYGEDGKDTIHSDGTEGFAWGGQGADEIAVNGEVGYGYGGPGNDRLTGPGFRGFSAVLLKGEAGNDVIVQRLPAQCRSNYATLDGGPGNDRITGAGCVHEIGGDGSDGLTVDPVSSDSGATLDAGDGRDFVVGGPSSEQIDAGAGRDFIQAAADDVADTITCGDGRDTVRADPLDTIAADCEHVTIVTQ